MHLNREFVYTLLYGLHKERYLQQGLTEDKASRKANIYAVKNTNILYNAYCTAPAKHWTAYEID